MKQLFRVKDDFVLQELGEIACTSEQLKEFVLDGYFTFSKNGQEVTRKVYDNKQCGLCIRYKGMVIFYSDFVEAE